MSFYGTTRHFELARYLGVVAPLQKQLDDLLFARTEPNSLLLHLILPLVRLPHPNGYTAELFPKCVASTLPF